MGQEISKPDGLGCAESRGVDDMAMCACVKSAVGIKPRIDEDAPSGAPEAQRFVGGVLHLAASRGDNLSLIAFIKEERFDPNTRDMLGRTPLMAAAHQGHLSTVKLLVDLGGDPSLEDRLGRTALVYANENGNSDVAFWVKWHVWDQRKRADDSAVYHGPPSWAAAAATPSPQAELRPREPRAKDPRRGFAPSARMGGNGQGASPATPRPVFSASAPASEAVQPRSARSAARLAGTGGGTPGAGGGVEVPTSSVKRELIPHEDAGGAAKPVSEALFDDDNDPGSAGPTAPPDAGGAAASLRTLELQGYSQLGARGEGAERGQ